MLVVMQSHATEAQVRAVCDRIEALGFKAHPIPGRGAHGDRNHRQHRSAVDIGSLESMAGVRRSAFRSASRTSSSAATSRKRTPSCGVPYAVG